MVQFSSDSYSGVFNDGGTASCGAATRKYSGPTNTSYQLTNLNEFSLKEVPVDGSGVTCPAQIPVVSIQMVPESSGQAYIEVDFHILVSDPSTYKFNVTQSSSGLEVLQAAGQAGGAIGQASSFMNVTISIPANANMSKLSIDTVAWTTSFLTRTDFMAADGTLAIQSVSGAVAANPGVFSCPLAQVDTVSGGISGAFELLQSLELSRATGYPQLGDPTDVKYVTTTYNKNQPRDEASSFQEDGSASGPTAGTTSSTTPPPQTAKLTIWSASGALTVHILSTSPSLNFNGDISTVGSAITLSYPAAWGNGTSSGTHFELTNSNASSTAGGSSVAGGTLAGQGQGQAGVGSLDTLTSSTTSGSVSAAPAAE
ncbi:MAG: hypothetical protein M1838_000412 [Thelocarpon superellum]|nr:MAG: hypothetical protein M1838_000412 [Thelocarpon superellum]